MKYRLTEQVIDVVNKHIGEERGFKKSFADKTGLDPQQISAIIHGKYKSVEEGTWFRLCAEIPELAKISSPVKSRGDRSAIVANGLVTQQQINKGNSSGVQNINTGSLDSYRVRVQDRLLEGDDPVPVKAVLKILKEEAE